MITHQPCQMCAAKIAYGSTTVTRDGVESAMVCCYKCAAIWAAVQKIRASLADVEEHDKYVRPIFTIRQANALLAWVERKI